MCATYWSAEGVAPVASRRAETNIEPAMMGR